MMLSIHVRLSLVALAFLPVIAAYSIFFYRKAGDRFLKADEAEGDVMTAVQENLTGVRVVRAFGRERYELDKFNRLNERFTNLWMRLGNLMGLYWGIGDLATGLQNAVILVLGVRAVVLGDDLLLGGLIALMTYNSYLIWPVRSLGRILSDMSRNGVSIQRIREILVEEPECDPPDAQEFAFEGNLTFEHVTFGYDENPIIKDISFTVKAGQTLAILGGTGSGKSTIAHLIPRLYELPEGQGRILIDGVDIRKLSLHCLRSQVGLVLQEPFLFSRTIAENIRATRSDLPFEALREYAATASVDSSILSFDKGYDTVVGERGVTLSAAEARVACAHAGAKPAHHDFRRFSLGGRHRDRRADSRRPQGALRQCHHTAHLPPRRHAHAGRLLMVLDKGPHRADGHPRAAHGARRHLPARLQHPAWRG